MKRLAPKPLVSIGIPVYNGERFLSQALTSLVGQSFSDFEIIISDNASTDGTQAICQDVAKRDTRVRYLRQERNIGAPRNWNVLVHEAKGAFFKWASANDYCALTMLERCVGVLQSDPGIVLCYGRTQLVGEDGQPLEIYPRDSGFEEESPSERFASVCSLLSLNNAQCGVFRLDVLRRSRLDRPYPSGDMALMAEVALYGRFRMLSDILLFRRQSRRTTTAMLSPMELQHVYDPLAKAPMKLIITRRYIDHMVSISRAPISWLEKWRAYVSAMRLARWDRVKLCREFLSLIGMGVKQKTFA